jgi:hypothetical protein
MVMVVMMMVVMVVMMMPMRHPDDDARPVSVMMVVMMVILRELDITIRGSRRPLFVNRLQQRGRIRDRLQELGIGVGP